MESQKVDHQRLATLCSMTHEVGLRSPRRGSREDGMLVCIEIDRNCHTCTRFSTDGLTARYWVQYAQELGNIIIHWYGLAYGIAVYGCDECLTVRDVDHASQLAV